MRISIVVTAILIVSHIIETGCAQQETEKVNNFAKCVMPISAYRPASPMYAKIKQQTLITRGKPLSIVAADSTSQVSKIVRCAKQTQLKICVRSGGHALDGRSLCNNGVMIDLNKMRNIYVTNGTALMGSGATLGEVYWKLHGKGRWFSGGDCPGVGVGGYFLGGGTGPYEARLGLGCDSLQEVTMVTRDGDVIQASHTLRQRLFWSMCGAGGAQFGIVTNFKIKTVPSTYYDRAVMFRFKWPLRKSGELLSKYVAYIPQDGNTWVRTVISKDGWGTAVMGACFDVDTIAECMNRMNNVAFFKVTGGRQLFLKKADSALEVAGFLGPEGKWGDRVPSDLYRAFNTQRFSESGKGNRETHQSAFLDFKGKLPSVEFWQKYAEFCNEPRLRSLSWIVCHINLFKGEVRKKRYTAFPFRAATVLAHFTIGHSNKIDRKAAYDRLREHFSNYTIGAYVNYQDPSLLESYPKMYWGNSLNDLKKLKAMYDPNGFFSNPQPIPTPTV